MTRHIEIRQKLGEMDVATLISTLNSIPLSSTDRTLMELRYLKCLDFGYIADYLGYSISTVKRRHKNILCKLMRTAG
jgi:DNA-directed RNA polymerase specialized sigma subunit